MSVPASPDEVMEQVAEGRPLRRLLVWLPLIVGLVLLFTAPLYLSSDYYVRIAVLVCIYGTMALGWNVLGGYGGQISLGHAVFFALGAYTPALLETDYHLTPWVGLVAGVVISLLVALLMGLPVFQLSGHYFALATLAFVQIGSILFTYFSGVTGGAVGMMEPLLGDPAMFQFASVQGYFYVAAVMLVLALLVSWAVLHSELGYRLRAIKENPVAASLAGVNLFRTKMVGLWISAALVSVAGSFYMQFTGSIEPETAFAFSATINMALFAIIGGVEVWWGPFLGALLLIPLNEYTSINLTGSLSPLGEVLYGVLLVIVILLRPRGLSPWLVDGWHWLLRKVA